LFTAPPTGPALLAMMTSTPFFPAIASRTAATTAAMTMAATVPAARAAFPAVLYARAQLIPLEFVVVAKLERSAVVHSCLLESQIA